MVYTLGCLFKAKLTSGDAQGSDRYHVPLFGINSQEANPGHWEHRSVFKPLHTQTHAHVYSKHAHPKPQHSLKH